MSNTKKEIRDFFRHNSDLSIKNIISLLEEEIFTNGKTHLDLIVELLVAYFIINDPGTIHQYDIEIDYVDNCNENSNKLLNLAKDIYPNSTELLFWENYINFSLYGLVDEVDHRFANQKETLVPFFYFYNEKTCEYEKEAELLFNQIEENGSFKENYIYSVLSSKFKRKKTK